MNREFVAAVVIILAVVLLIGRKIMQKLDSIIAQQRAALDTIKAERATDAAQIADLKAKLADAPTPEQVATLQGLADEMTALATPPAPTEPATPAGG